MMDLDKDYHVNGETFHAGKNVDTKYVFTDQEGNLHNLDAEDDIRRMQQAEQELSDSQGQV